MAVAEELRRKINGYIDDVNIKEIASQIESNNLRQWTESWGNAFKRLIREVLNCYEQNHGWISIKEAKPRSEEMVQLLIYDDHGDYPSVYVDCGFRYEVGRVGQSEIWISYDDHVTHEKVIAWKPLQDALTVKEIKELNWV